MAFEIYDKPGIGQTIGAGLGAGIGTGLQGLAQQKLGQMQQSMQRKGIAKGLEALGFSPQESEQLSQFEPTLLREIVKSKMEEPQRQAFAQALGLGQPINQQDIAAANMSNPAEIRGVELSQAPQLKPEQALKLKQLQMQEQEAKEKRAFQEKKLSAIEKKEAFKETRKVRDEIAQKGKTSFENIMRFNKMEQLNKRDKLSNPVYVNVLEKLGWDIPALMSKDSGEFQKLTIDFLRDARSMFGARVTNFEASTFLKSIPNLKMTKEQRSAVIDNLKIMNQIPIERANVMRQIIKENKGVPPFDLAEQIEERLSPKLDELALKFKENTKELSGTPQDVSKQIEQFQPASANKGRKIRDTETGVIFQSDGTTWQPIGQ